MTSCWKIWRIFSFVWNCSCVPFEIKIYNKMKLKAMCSQTVNFIACLPWVVELWMYLSFNYPCFAKWQSKYLHIIGVKWLHCFACKCSKFVISFHISVAQLLHYSNVCMFISINFWAAKVDFKSYTMLYTHNGSLAAHSPNNFGPTQKHTALPFANRK